MYPVKKARPVDELISVVFPAPDGPMIAITRGPAGSPAHLFSGVFAVCTTGVRGVLGVPPVGKWGSSVDIIWNGGGRWREGGHIMGVRLMHSCR